MERGERRPADRARVLRQRRLQGEDPHRPRRRQRTHPHLRLGRRRSQGVRGQRERRGHHRRDREPHLARHPVGRGGRHLRRRRVRRAEQPEPAGRPLLQQGPPRRGRRGGSDHLGRADDGGGDAQREGHRPVLRRRPVQVALPHVDPVPHRPGRWTRGVPGGARRRGRRVVRPRLRRGAHDDPGPRQGGRLRRRLRLDRGRRERRPGPAVHRPRRVPAPGGAGLLGHEDRLARLRRQRPRLHHLPRRRGWCGRPEEHRRQHLELLVGLRHRERRGQGRRHELPRHGRLRRGVHADAARGRRRPAGRGHGGRDRGDRGLRVRRDGVRHGQGSAALPASPGTRRSRRTRRRSSSPTWRRSSCCRARRSSSSTR